MRRFLRRFAGKMVAAARARLGRLVPSPGQSEGSAAPFVPAGHFYSPIPDLNDVRRRADRLFDVSAPSIAGVNLREAEQLELLKSFRPFYAEQPFHSAPVADRRYHFENSFYSYSDALCLHFMLRHLRPRRVIEIGSGFSSAVMLDTNDLFLEGRVRHTFIEPFPDVLRSRLRRSDASVEILERPLQEVGLERFSELDANDILFVDSTHVSKIGSDVNRIFSDILPALRPGVYVHFHDIFYPFEYPRFWIEEGRAWNEAYVLRAFLQYNREFEIVLFNTFLTLRHRALVEEEFPLFMKNTGGSIWLRRASVGTR